MGHREQGWVSIMKPAGWNKHTHTHTQCMQFYTEGDFLKTSLKDAAPEKKKKKQPQNWTDEKICNLHLFQKKKSGHYIDSPTKNNKQRNKNSGSDVKPEMG